MDEHETHTLYLTGYDINRRVNAIKGVRAAIGMLDQAEDGTTVSLMRAGSIVAGFIQMEGLPQVIGTSDDLDTVLRAQEALAEESKGAAEGAVDIDPGDYLQPGEDPAPVAEADAPEEYFSIPSIRTAMVLMSAANGNPAGALSLASLLARSTEDDQFFDEVAEMVLDVFARAPEEP